MKGEVERVAETCKEGDAKEAGYKREKVEEVREGGAKDADFKAGGTLELEGFALLQRQQRACFAVVKAAHALATCSLDTYEAARSNLQAVLQAELDHCVSKKKALQ